ncbi:sulfotransferase [Anderseniella sp. Alg231-50]|uniref:sulfotransferase n=1 Tax=Anderseniella sp. Alg231-50 TaxID=1922226 RepID=UPI000D54E2A8
MTYPPPKALLRLPPSRNKRVRSGIAAIRLLLRKALLQEAAVQLQQLQQHEPANVEIALLQAELLTLGGDHDRSCQLLKQILSRHPGLVPALVLSARAHTAAQRHLDALDALQLAHQLTPQDHDIAKQLAETLVLLRCPSKAIAVLAPLVRKSKSPADIAQLAGLHDKAGNLEECLAGYDSIRPPIPDIHVLKAGALLVRGKKSDARAAVDDAILAAPDNASLRLFVAKNFADDFDPARQAQEIDTILASPGASTLSAEDRARLGFALGLAHERNGDFAKAFRAVEEANSHAKPECFTKDQQLEKVALGIAEHFTKARLAQLAPAGNASQKPVFVTGLPRSGTTLVEQMIASHPDAASVGELELIPALKQSLVSLQSSDIKRCAQAWLDAVPESKTDKARIVDKSISTVLHTGLAMLMFPRARFVFVRRHPMDIYWSAYREMFGMNALTFTYATQPLVRHIQLSEHLMSVWQQRFPDRVLTVKYEDIVNDPERHIRSMIAHTGLDWSDDCLEFHKSNSDVRTASMAQVREPVYKSSVGKWQAYHSQLAPVATALADLIANYEKAPA